MKIMLFHANNIILSGQDSKIFHKSKRNKEIAHSTNILSSINLIQFLEIKTLNYFWLKIKCFLLRFFSSNLGLKKET